MPESYFDDIGYEFPEQDETFFGHDVFNVSVSYKDQLLLRNGTCIRADLDGRTLKIAELENGMVVREDETEGEFVWPRQASTLGQTIWVQMHHSDQRFLYEGRVIRHDYMSPFDNAIVKLENQRIVYVRECLYKQLQFPWIPNPDAIPHPIRVPEL